MSTKKTTTKQEESPVIKGFKGFDKDLKCRAGQQGETQYKVGEDFEMDSTKKLVCCPSNFNTEGGLHFCENPFDVWNYYGVAKGTRYAEVESRGETLKNSADSKVATSKLHVSAEITLDKFIKCCFKFVWDKINWKDAEKVNTLRYGQAAASGDNGQAAASGYKGQAAASGSYGQAAASGFYGQAAASGFYGQAAASGDNGQAAASGYKGQAAASGSYGQAAASGSYGQAAASGFYGQAAASGDNGQAAASGSYGQAAASGFYGQAAASGDNGQAAASGSYGQAAASGSYGQAAASGDNGQAAASGSYGQAAASGSYGQAAASGYKGQAATSGDNGISVSTGIEGMAQGKKGNWLVLAEYEKDKYDKYQIVQVLTIKVDGKKIKENTFYELKKGKFVVVV